MQVINERTSGGSTGSGAIIDIDRGLVVTNQHVVSGAEKLSVNVAGKRLPAELVGADASTDIALLKLSSATADFTAIPMGDSRSLKIGDVVFAAGHPFGLDLTVTMGIISGLGRTGVGTELEDFIQTDAPINSGNSGGPLLDSNGKLIGINTAIYAPTGGNVGIGYAVPTTILNVVVAQLREFGRVTRGTIGIHARSAESSQTQGAVVSAVAEDSPAERAGLQLEDIIVRAQSETISDPTDLRRVIALTLPGHMITLELERRGRTLRADVEVSPPRDTQVSATSGGTIEAFGAYFAEVPEDHPLSGRISGVLLERLQEGGPLALLGFAEGDVVTQVNQTTIGSLTDFKAALNASAGRKTLVIARGNSLRPIVVP